jgi:hypothetical protein
LGSIGTLALPPQAARATQTAAIGVNLVVNSAVCFMARGPVPDTSWLWPPVPQLPEWAVAGSGYACSIGR